MINTFSTEIPVSKAILDQEASLVRLISEANEAVYAVMRAVANDLPCPIASNLLGTSPEVVKVIGGAKSKITPLLFTGVPIFKIRLATDETAALVNSNASSDSLFDNLLNSFADELSIRSI